MKSLKSVLAATILTATLASSAFAGAITTKPGAITTKPGAITTGAITTGAITTDADIINTILGAITTIISSVG
jgi:hypothetical protein